MELDERMAEWCRSTCLALPGATVDEPFGPGTEAFRLHGRIFALLTQTQKVSPHPIVNLKAEPSEVPLLVRTYPFVVPGWHMSKKHWVSVILGPETDLELAAELVEDSYDNVALRLPRHLRPDLAALGPREPGVAVVGP